MTFPKDFHDFIINFIYPWECVYEKGHYGDLNYVITETDPNDSGNIGDGITPGNKGTKFGIDASSHPGINISALTSDTAEMIYWQDFISSKSIMLPGRLALYSFDEAVNAGDEAEDEILQIVGNVEIDGILGPLSLLAIWNAWEIDPATLINNLLNARIARYRTIVKNNPNDAEYLQGWLNRVENLRNFKFATS